MRAAASTARSTGARSDRPEKYERTRARRSVALRVAKEVDPGPGRHALRQAAPGADAAPLGRAQADHVGHRRRAALLCQSEEADEHLRRRKRVGKRPMARSHLRVEALGERAQVHPLEPVAQKPAGERDRVDDRRCQPSAAQAGEVGVDEPDVEAGVVGHQHRPGAEAQELVEHRPDARPPANMMGGDAGDLSDLAGDEAAGIDEPLHPGGLGEPAQAHGTELDDP